MKSGLRPVPCLTGMRLAGVEGVIVHEHDELKEALERTIADKEIGIILLTEKFGREFPEIIDDVKLHHKTPLIIEIPDGVLRPRRCHRSV